MTKLIGAFHDYANAPKNVKSAEQWSPETIILAMDAVTSLPLSSLDLRERCSCRTKSSGMCRLRCLVKSYRRMPISSGSNRSRRHSDWLPPSSQKNNSEERGSRSL